MTSSLGIAHGQLKQNKTPFKLFIRRSGGKVEEVGFFFNWDSLTKNEKTYSLVKKNRQRVLFSYPSR